MNAIDLVLLILIGSSVIAGLRAGLAQSGIGLACSIFGVICGLWFYSVPAVLFRGFTHSDFLANALGFLAVLVPFLVLGAVAGRLASKFFQWIGLSWLDRLAGAGFGFLRGALVAVGLVAILLAFAPKPLPSWIVSSNSLPYAVGASSLLSELAPQGVKEAVQERLEDVREAWQRELQKGREEINAMRSAATGEETKPEPVKPEPAKMRNKQPEKKR